MVRFGLLTSLLVLIVDQMSKLWIVYDVMDPPRAIEIAPFFNVVMVWNKGASFGMFATDSPSTQYLLSAIAAVICIVLFLWLRKATTGWLAIALGAVIGGALGNVVDRLRFGAVADFLDFHAAGYHWPAFNVADIAITVGVGMLVLDGLIGRRGDHRFKS